MRCLAQKSINSHQGHPRLPPTQRDGNTVGTPLVHRSPAVYQRWTNPDLSAQTARAAVRRSVGRSGVGASPPSPGSSTGTGQQGVCREDALVEGGSRSRVSTGGIGCGMRWERIGPTASVSVGLRWADRVASSGRVQRNPLGSPAWRAVTECTAFTWKVYQSVVSCTDLHRKVKVSLS